MTGLILVALKWINKVVTVAASGISLQFVVYPIHRSGIAKDVGIHSAAAGQTLLDQIIDRGHNWVLFSRNSFCI